MLLFINPACRPNDARSCTSANHVCLRLELYQRRGVRSIRCFFFSLLQELLILSHFLHHITNMPTMPANTLRQASRLCLKQSSSTTSVLRNSAARAAGISNQTTSKRGYVSATKKDNAQINVDTAIRADQKAFFAETGKLPENTIMPGTDVNADAMMSPMAGTLNSAKQRTFADLNFHRCSEASHSYG